MSGKKIIDGLKEAYSIELSTVSTTNRDDYEFKTPQEFKIEKKIADTLEARMDRMQRQALGMSIDEKPLKDITPYIRKIDCK